MNKKIPLDRLGSSDIPESLLVTGSMESIPSFDGLGSGVGDLDVHFAADDEADPDLTSGSAEEMDLLSLNEEPIVNLDWLDPTQLQDEERLPKNSVDTMIPELVEAWGVNRPTDGQTVYAKDLGTARYEASLNAPSKPSKKASSEQLIKVVAHAMRRSAAGQDIDMVVKEALESMGEEMGRIASSLRKVREEHGLVGNVYIRAAAYPGYGTGKWASHVKKQAPRARYIIVSSEELSGASWIQNGRCIYTGKKAVTSIPWGEAYEHYAPRLASVGREVPEGDARSALKYAFTTLPERRASDPGYLPIHAEPADRISSEEAREIFSKATVEQKVFDPSSSRAAKERKEAEEKIHRMAREGLISGVTRDRVLASRASPYNMLLSAAKIACLPKTSDYEGTEFSSHSLNRIQAMNDAGTEVALLATAKKKVAELQKKGLLTKDQAQESLSYKTAKEIIEKASHLVAQPRTGEYKNSVFTAHNVVASQSFGDKAPALSKVASAALTWIRRAMSEGFAGKALDELIQHRFAKALQADITENIREVRASHEGGSGFLYVDAAAYASSSGVKGCEEGALKHRANQIPSVLQMERCASCIHARIREGGESKCGLYNKALLEEAGGQDIQRMKSANIKASNMHDAESTASMFATTYDPSEFDLSNDNLEDVEAPLPETDEMSDIFFGGWDI